MASLVNGAGSVKGIEKYIRNLAGGMGQEEGVRFGLTSKEVSKVLVCWMINVEAVEYAASIGADLIITHESLFYPYDVLENKVVPEFMTWDTNYHRMALLAKHDITVIRAHYSLDKVCIFDDFASVLGLGEPVVSKADFIKIYEVQPITYGDLIEQVKQRLKLPYVRATRGSRARKVKRIGLPWGGLGLFVNVGYMQSLINEGCDVFIAGESDNYGFRFAVDAGIDMIETGHEISENPGLQHFTEMLAEAFPMLEVEFYENQPPFVVE